MKKATHNLVRRTTKVTSRGIVLSWVFSRGVFRCEGWSFDFLDFGEGKGGGMGRGLSQAFVVGFVGGFEERW